LQLGIVELSEFLRELVRDWEKKLTTKQISIAVDIQPKLSPIRVDRTRLQEALYNLLDNAVKYSRERSEIRVSARQSDHEIELSVNDQGIGIAKEDLPRIFERFYRAEKSRTRRETTGFGLGLSIANWIVEHHGGRIEVNSQEGKGTAFAIWLPLYKNNK
jgi:signal transduction histidine kinase